jgi:predicted amidohydrolase
VSYVNIALLQLALDSGSSNNIEFLEAEIKRIIGKFPATDLVLLPELACFGVSTQIDPALTQLAFTRFSALAKSLSIWLIPGSFFVKENNAIYNRSPVFNPQGELVTAHDKLFPFCPFEAGVTSGHEVTVFDIEGIGRFGLCICYDMWFPEVTRSMVHLGAEVILHPTLTTSMDREVELSITRASAATNQCCFVDVNAAGTLGVGQSLVVGSGGEVIYQSNVGQECFVITLDLNQVRHNRVQGWNQLGQVLKSYRDSTIVFPQDGQHGNSSYLKALGPLEKPLKPVRNQS